MNFYKLQSIQIRVIMKDKKKLKMTGKMNQNLNQKQHKKKNHQTQKMMTNTYFNPVIQWLEEDIG